MYNSLQVAYDKGRLQKDAADTVKLRSLVEARDDYRKLYDMEANSCRELDVKVPIFTSTDCGAGAGSPVRGL